MDISELKIILMLLLCVPVLAAGIIVFTRTLSEEKHSVVVEPVKKEKLKK